jgi:hypothetical protein
MDRPLFAIHQWERQRRSIIYHFQQSPFVSGSSQFIHHSVIQFSHEVYYAMRESMLGTWVDTWIWRDFIT